VNRAAVKSNALPSKSHRNEFRRGLGEQSAGMKTKNRHEDDANQSPFDVAFCRRNQAFEFYGRGPVRCPPEIAKLAKSPWMDANAARSPAVTSNMEINRELLVNTAPIAALSEVPPTFSNMFEA